MNEPHDKLKVKDSLHTKHIMVQETCVQKDIALPGVLRNGHLKGIGPMRATTINSMITAIQ